MTCEWIFRLPAPDGCPKCQWPSYGARHVYGDKAYRYERTQEPWMNKKLDALRFELQREVDDRRKAACSSLTNNSFS